MRYRDIQPLSPSVLENIKNQPIPPGYPDELYTMDVDRYITASRVFIAENAAHVANHANRLRAPNPVVYNQANTAPKSVQEQWLEMGLDVDTIGRPLNPYAAQFLGDPALGMATGPGKFYGYGPNDRALVVLSRQFDPYADEEYLLIERDGGWDFPGGFVQPGELVMSAAFRKLDQLVGIDPLRLDGVAIGSRYTAVPSRDDTLHAWKEQVIVTVRNPNQGYLYSEQFETAPHHYAWRSMKEIVEGDYSSETLGHIELADSLWPKAFQEQ